MEKMFEWIRATFQHPAILLFIVVGVMFLALGFGADFPVPMTDQTFSLKDEKFMIPCIGLGILFIALAIILMYNPPVGWRGRGWHTSGSKNLPVTRAEMTDAHPGAGAPFHARRAALSETQKSILSLIEQERKLAFAVIKTEMAFDNESELYYRLEQIRLLGFVEKDKLKQSPNSSVWIYQLAEPYAELLGDAEPDKTTFTGDNEGKQNI